MKRKVLVVGATGFIGSNLVRKLVDDKFDVRVLVRREADLIFFDPLNVEYFLGDLLDYKSLLRSTKGINIVFNASGALPYHKLSDGEYWEINVNGVENLMKASLKNKVERVVHLSTVGIYGEIANGVDENTLPNPSGVYAQTKLEGDKILKKYQAKISGVIIRPTIAYGPGDTRPVILSLFKLINKRISFQIGDGKNYFHTVYISNLVDAIILASRSKKASGNDFIIGDEPVTTFKELSKTIVAVGHKKVFVLNISKFFAYLFFGRFIRGKLDFVTNQKRYRIDKAKKVLGYKPKVKLKEGIEKTFVWYKQNNLF